MKGRLVWFHLCLQELEGQEQLVCNGLIRCKWDVLLYSDFYRKYDFDCNHKEFKSLNKATQNTVLILAKYILLYSLSPSHLPTLLINVIHFLDTRCSNKLTWSILTNHLYPEQNKYPVPPKTKEINYKAINDFYPQREFLRLRFGLKARNVFSVKGILKKQSTSLVNRPVNLCIYYLFQVSILSCIMFDPLLFFFIIISLIYPFVLSLQLFCSCGVCSFYMTKSFEIKKKKKICLVPWLP